MMTGLYVIAIIMLISVQIVSAQIVSAQIDIYKQPYNPLKEYKKDTARYLKENFVDNREYFIGKPLSFLVKKLDCKIVNVIPSGTLSAIYTAGIYFCFFPANTYPSKDKSKMLPLLIIKLKGHLSSVDSAYSLAKKNGAKWTQDEMNYYGHQIIEDISISGMKNDDEAPYSDTKGVGVLYKHLY